MACERDYYSTVSYCIIVLYKHRTSFEGSFREFLAADALTSAPGTLILTGPLFPIGIEHLIYMEFLCYGSSYGY